jgi:hypothetical protein
MKCASACFLMFAAGSVRFFGPHGVIGVHSASAPDTASDDPDDRTETLSSMAYTLSMARDYEALGVPDRIIVKMITTKNDDMAFVKADELSGWAKSF